MAMRPAARSCHVTPQLQRALQLLLLLLLLAPLLLPVPAAEARNITRRKALFFSYPGLLWHRVATKMHPWEVVPPNSTLGATGKGKLAINVYKFQGDYVLFFHAWAKYTQNPPKTVVVGDGFGGNPSTPLFNITGVWTPGDDGPRLHLRVFIDNAREKIVPGLKISYAQLLQNINGGLGRFNAQLIERGSDQPTLRGQLHKGWPWRFSPFNFP